MNFLRNVFSGNDSSENDEEEVEYSLSELPPDFWQPVCEAVHLEPRTFTLTRREFRESWARYKEGKEKEKEAIAKTFGTTKEAPPAVIVKTLDGSCIVLPYDQAETIGKFRDRLSLEMEVDSKLLRLIFGGFQLQLERTFNDYNIQPNSTIHVVQRLVGGQQS